MESISTTADETVFIENVCKEIGKGIIHIMLQEYFKPAYEAAIHRESVWKAISDPTNPNKQYWNWAENATVRALQCDSLNRHLVMSEATELVGLLYESNQKTAKYPGEVKLESESESEEEEEDDVHSNSSHGSKYDPKNNTDDTGTTGSPDTGDATCVGDSPPESPTHNSLRNRAKSAKAKENGSN